MSTIRRQSLISSGVVYVGFALGALNNLLFARWLTTEQNGLASMFVAIGNIIYPIANIGMPAFINKFYPYYKDNLAEKDIDLLSRAFAYAAVGFVIVAVGAYFFEPVVLRKFGARSKLFVDFYFLRPEYFVVIFQGVFLVFQYCFFVPEC